MTASKFVGRGHRNAKKTHCPQGHEYSGDNLLIRYKKGKSGNQIQSRECKICVSDQRKKRPTLLKTRQQYLWTTYRLTVEQYEQLLQNQEGVCKVCHQKPPQDNKNFDVDHDHKCCPSKRSCGKCIRGLLCRRCNLILGYVQESSDLLIELANYLDTAKVLEWQ